MLTFYFTSPQPLNLSPDPSPEKRGEKDKARGFLVYDFDNDIVVVNGVWLESAIAINNIQYNKTPNIKKMKLQVILEPSDEGGYTVSVPALPGCISEGDNIDEALENITEAIELYLEPIEEDTNSNKDIIVRELVI